MYAHAVAAEHKPPPGLDETPLHIAGSWLQALTDGSHEVVALLDEDGSVQYLSMSGAVQAMLGYDALEIMDMAATELVHPLDQRRVLDAFRTIAGHAGGRMTIEYRVRHKAGHWVRLESTAVNRLHNEWVNAIVVHTREPHGPEMPPPSVPMMQPMDDEEGISRHIDEAIEKTAGGTYKFSVLVLELERVSQIQEGLGPDVVEAVAREVGRRLAALLRPGDKLGRLAGGQFAILLEGVGDRALAQRIAARVQKTVGSRFNVKGQDVLSPTLLGIATSERAYDCADDVLRDALLATAKARGVGPERRAVFRTQMQLEKSRHMSLMAELHGALQRNELRVHYLPIVNLATRTLSGFEALARWQHPERGIISPDLFIPIAEETGLIMRLGRWMLLAACRQLVEWQRRYELDPPLFMTVNVSGRQFADFDFDEQVDGILHDTDLDPKLLVLEIGERALIDHREAVTEGVRRLGKHGIKLCLDNFGSGVSSFSQLGQLPYNRLSIDRTLVQRIQQGGRERDAVKAIVAMAHGMSMEVVAEGVESPGHAAQLSELRCEYASGYLYGKPMDADAAGGLIASYPRWWS
jgi:PAS domain S-box-containing protein